ncbi:M48 family metalloprotease [Pannonibacter tanglangensis]|uniref:M48 family metalloprotease n=1 Tax=Pannonibacter tanglangensis TaxID=2750084 RepID=A0ABW9ZC17_9HYPH|nr:M48 family metalloprotease [Pannonibacter sp. XCT-34]
MTATPASPPLARARRAASLLRQAAALVLATALVLPTLGSRAEAQGRKIPLVRDAETEELLRDYAKPIFQVAGIAQGQVEIILVNDTDFNAFVPDARRMFINIGVIMGAETPGEVIGVIAHEAGHIAGRHLVRLREAVANAQIMAVIGTVLGAGAVVAGASQGAGGLDGGGAAMALSAGSIGQRSLLAYQRGEEAAADKAALRYLELTGQSARGMLKTFERFADQQLVSARYADPYAMSHPMARERYAALEEGARKSRFFDTPAPPALQARHDLVRAKLIAFASHPNVVAREFPASDTSLPAQYARAIAAMQSRGKGALKEIDALIRQQPNNPYFHELRGQALLESGSPREAIPSFQRALALRPNEGQFHIWLGYALVGSNDKALLPEAERVLKAGIQRDPNSGIAYSQLAIALGRQGKQAEADLATAQGLMTSGDVEGARRYAARAQKNLKRGSPAWLQADDIVAYKPPQFGR